MSSPGVGLPAFRTRLELLLPGAACFRPALVVPVFLFGWRAVGVSADFRAADEPYGPRGG